MSSTRATLGVLLLGLSLPGAAAAAQDPGGDARAAKLVAERCASCHRFEGEPKAKLELRGPDLMWAGQKYQRAWLVGWLQGRERSPYPARYRWDAALAAPHPRVSADDAEAIADHFERNARDPRVREGAFDPKTVTRKEAEIGGRLFREYACIGCHPVLEGGVPVGGPISTHFYDAARRYDPDWVFAFNMDPPAFTPHSGEYVADLTERRVRWVTGYILSLGAEDFPFARPWEGEAFRSADAERGRQTYREYCAQCHGLSGEGDGPGAVGLQPKPAAHARMAIDQLPADYLYEVVYYGGAAVGKSALMPDWGLTLDARQLADVLAYMRASFRGAPAEAAAAPVCPQPRATAQAPPELLAARNPLDPTPEHLAAGERLYRQGATPMACQLCHGERGDGLGPMAAGFTPRPRNFTCAETMRDLPDGQLFWIVRNGSPGTGMLAYATLSDEQIWQLVLFLRRLAEPAPGPQ
jgi:mono/diheme cytochrome c family protein